MNVADVNAWLMIPGGASIGGVLLWKFLSRARVDISRDRVDQAHLEGQMEASRAWRKERDEAEARASASNAALVREERRANALELRVTSLERESADLKEHLRNLAQMLLEIAPESRIFVQQWLHTSGLDQD